MPKVIGAVAPAVGAALRVQVEGRPVAVFNVGGELRAVDARCTHAGGPLEQGSVSNGAVTCPWHGSRFTLASGAVEQGPAIRGVRAYRVTVEPDGLQIEPA